MEIFDSINLYLLNHPLLLNQLEFLFKVKYWLFLTMAIYFILLPYRQRLHDIKEQKKLSKKPGKFLA